MENPRATHHHGFSERTLTIWAPLTCARGSCGCGSPAFRVHGLDGAEKGPVCPANLVCASGSSWDFPALAFALPGSGLGSALLWARSRGGPGWLGVCRWRWLHEAGHDVEFRIQGPSPVGEGLEVLARVLCGFSSCRRFSFWPPTLPGTPLPACQPARLPLRSLPAVQPLHSLAAPRRSEFLKVSSWEN